MARDVAALVPFIDGNHASRVQNSTANDTGAVAPQTAIRTNGLPVEADNPFPIRNTGARLLASAASEAAHVFANVAADLSSISVSGLSDFAWLLVFDAASIPSDGAVAPLAAVQATSLVGTSISFGGASAAFQAGVVGVLSTTGPFVKTTGPTGFFSALVR